MGTSMVLVIVGNTSACAEKRWHCTYRAGTPWKYLRVRGEERGISPKFV